MTQITSDKIVQQALKLIQMEGDKFSMRQLGRELQVDAKAIYYYYKSKDELINAVVAHAIGELELNTLDDSLTWQAQLRYIARSYYQLAAKYPNLIPYLMRVDGSVPAVFEVVEQLVAILVRTPLEIASIIQIIDLFMSILPSFSITHPDNGDLLAYLQNLPAEQYPKTAELAHLIQPKDLEDNLDLQINIVISGIEALIKNSL